MQKPLVKFMFLLLSMPAFCQTKAETEAILVPVNQLFAGMNKGDSAMVHGAFFDNVSFSSIYKDKTGKPVIRPEALGEFLVAVGTAHPEAWSEPIWDTQVQMDGNFAQVWAKYGFYVGKKFSHCGVDAFHLFKGPDGTWKIFHLADTRQKEGCVVPEGVKERFK